MIKHFVVEVECPDNVEEHMPIRALRNQIEKGSPEKPVYISKVISEYNDKCICDYCDSMHDELLCNRCGGKVLGN